jgi:hypothetical protein
MAKRPRKPAGESIRARDLSPHDRRQRTDGYGSATEIVEAHDHSDDAPLPHPAQDQVP